ncbi:MAG: AAA family ATPase [Candidatus Diapherotrites archaeon]|nr:AAA family ATPase [Candidatus Diapherotrites archaeon]
MALKIVLTGSPGTGKSSVAKILAKKLNAQVVNDLDFCKKNRIGAFDRKAKERVVPVERLERALKKFLAKTPAKNAKSVILEGHLLCEISIPCDAVVVLRLAPEKLEKRLAKRGYPEVKVLDNVFCEETGYCKTRVLRNYPANKLVEIVSSDPAEKTAKKILDCPALRG